MSDRVLIIDPEMGTVEVLRQYLLEEGYECDAFSSPRIALEHMKQHKYSLLLVEMELPGMTGLQVLKRVTELDPELAILVTSASMDVSAALEAMRLGAFDFLFKPFHISGLAFGIEKALERRKLLIENRQYQLHLEERVREATAELQKTKDYLQNLLDSSVDTVLTISPEFTISYANSGAEEMLGYGKGELEGVPIVEILGGGDMEWVGLKDHLEQGPIHNHETVLLTRDNREIPVMTSITRMRGDENSAASTLAICKDITQQKRLQMQLKEMTIKDSLTDLYNQRHFYQRMDSEIERARRQNRPLSLILFDVDRFKTYNDLHGHLAGDGVLRGIGEVVKECTRDKVDTGFRYGGDEFTVILPEAEKEQACQIAERIRTTFLARRFDDCALSMGVASYSPDLSTQVFIKHADVMMYAAKKVGGNCVQYYDPEVAAAVDSGKRESLR